MKYTHVFWDWNGTLLDDLDYCIDVVNVSLSSRGMNIMTKETYHKLFHFPIKDYYRDLGFDFEKDSYDDLAVEFNSNYALYDDKLSLRKHAKEVLAVFRGKKIPQYILSASERVVLETALARYGIDGYFEKVLCTDNVLAEGKISYGKKFVDTLPVDRKILLVGDTEHDIETAEAIGADVVLVKGGHTSDEKLSTLGVKVISDLHELYPIILGETVSPAKIKPPMTAAEAEKRSFDINEAEPKNFRTRYKDFYDDLKNTNKTEDW